MDNNQTNNPNNSVPGFGNNNVPSDMPAPSVPTPSAPANNPAPNTIPANNMPVQEGEIPTPKMPDGGTESFAGLDTRNNFAKQTIVGGIEEPQSKSKNLFSLPKHQEPVQTPAPAPVPATTQITENIPANVTPVTPSYNEVTAGSTKSKFAMIAIAAGAVLLLLAGGGYYYYFVYMNRQSEQPTEVVVEEPVTEIPAEPVVDMTIDQDPYMIMLDQMDQTVASDPSQLQLQLQTLDFGSIDQELSPTESLMMQEELPPITESTNDLAPTQDETAPILQ